MNKEPIALYIFRFVVGFCVVLFLAMLYYSSQLIEDDIKEVQDELDQVQLELRQLRADIANVSFSYSSVFASGQESAALAHADLSLPNLLETDPFFTQTLPKRLPEGFRPQGVLSSGEMGKPQNLHPFGAWAFINYAWDLCTVSVAGMQFGKYDTFAPAMAVRIEERPVASDSTLSEYWIFLRDNVYWQPLRADFFPVGFPLDKKFLQRHKVTAHDFLFWFNVAMNPHVQEGGASSLRNYIGDIEEFRVIDDYTMVVRWRPETFVDPETGKEESRVKYIAKQWTGALRPLPRWLYQYFSDGEKIIEDEGDPQVYRTHSVWAQNFSQHWAQHIVPSCGAWVFDGMTDREVRFRRNPDHWEPYAALTEEVAVLFRESPDALWQDFKAGIVDTWDSSASPEKLIELYDFEQSNTYADQVAAGAPIHRIDYLARAYRYIGWNFQTPYFSSRKVRQAMTMAIDRQRIIERYLNHMAVTLTGPFFPGDPEYDTTLADYPFDPLEAQRLLEEEGWYDSDGDGIRDKMIEGKRVPFRFRLMYYVKSTGGRVICDYVATALREIGVECLPTGVDVADLSIAFEGKDFDAIYMGWSLGSPPSEPKQLWHSAGAKENGSSNAIGFANAEVDAAIDQLQYEYNSEQRLELYHCLHRLIYEEAPYTFLAVPKVALLYRGYLQDLFIPSERQDLIPGANVEQPSLRVAWLSQKQG